jgi:hypothetical protein
MRVRRGRLVSSREEAKDAKALHHAFLNVGLEGFCWVAC